MCDITMHAGVAGRYARSICIDGCHLGHQNMASIEGWPVLSQTSPYTFPHAKWTGYGGLAMLIKH